MESAAPPPPGDLMTGGDEAFPPHLLGQVAKQAQSGLSDTAGPLQTLLWGLMQQD